MALELNEMSQQKVPEIKLSQNEIKSLKLELEEMADFRLPDLEIEQKNVTMGEINLPKQEVQLPSVEMPEFEGESEPDFLKVTKLNF